jgi:AsmA protein
MDFSTNLTLQGKTLAEAKQTMTGTILLSGENLAINGTDLDEQFARFESSQNFNLVDAGAFLFAGPLGLVVTKGYNFANIFLDAGTSSEIRAVISDWTVEAGVAQAKDVAMTTNENRIALKGGLDFYNKQFNDVTIALLDDAGCAIVKQEIHGSFQAPEIARPSVLRSLAGPIITLLQKLVPADDCEVFYSGSLETKK